MAKADGKKRAVSKRYWGFNIVVTTVRTDRDALYSDAVRRLYNDPVHIQVSNDKVVILRTQFSINMTFRGVQHDVIYGNIIRYTLTEGRWYDDTKRDFANFSVPENLHPSGFESEYIFIPAAHRFFVAVQSKISVNMVAQYLKAGMERVINPSEKVRVTAIKERDSINLILNAPELLSLELTVSYTNDDVGDLAQEAMDKLLKEDNVGEITAVIKPDHTGKLITKGEFLRGMLELSKDHGTAKATILNDRGKRKKIDTAKFPEKFVAKAESGELDEVKQSLFQIIMAKYRNARGRGTNN